VIRPPNRGKRPLIIPLGGNNGLALYLWIAEMIREPDKRQVLDRWAFYL
jgi:hypothetical protein